MTLDLTGNQFFTARAKTNPFGIIPSAVKPTSLTADFIKSTSVNTSSAISVPNGSSLIVQTIIASATNKNIILGGVPFCIIFFQGALDTSKMIGASLTGSGYQIKGPQAIPTFTPLAVNGATTTYGGSTGKNLVYVTELYNNTGSTQTIYYIDNARFIQSGGGSTTS